MPREGLTAARQARNDEFYTKLDDIAKELKYYKQYFKDKVVLCNCDDPYESNFFKYFALNFNQLGLKKLIATCYDGSPIAGDELPLLFEIEYGSASARHRCRRTMAVFPARYPVGGNTVWAQVQVVVICWKTSE